MSPLERAARAMARFAADEQYGAATTDVDRESNEAWWRDYVPAARAVIEAIREPSEAMVQAYADGIDKDACISPEAYWIRDDGFSAMIDALLEEGA